jgi:hypothetical protein
MMKVYVATPVRLPTGELTGHVGIGEAKLPKEFQLSNVVTLRKKTAWAAAQLSRGVFYLPCGVLLVPLFGPVGAEPSFNEAL